MGVGQAPSFWEASGWWPQEEDTGKVGRAWLLQATSDTRVFRLEVEEGFTRSNNVSEVLAACLIVHKLYRCF